MTRASSSSRRGRLGESAMTARGLFPHTPRAAAPRKTRSTPPQETTKREPPERNRPRQVAQFFRAAKGKGENNTKGWGDREGEGGGGGGDALFLSLSRADPGNEKILVNIFRAKGKEKKPAPHHRRHFRLRGMESRLDDSGECVCIAAM